MSKIAQLTLEVIKKEMKLSYHPPTNQNIPSSVQQTKSQISYSQLFNLQSDKVLLCQLLFPSAALSCLSRHCFVNTQEHSVQHQGIDKFVTQSKNISWYVTLPSHCIGYCSGRRKFPPSSWKHKLCQATVIYINNEKFNISRLYSLLE